MSVAIVLPEAQLTGWSERVRERNLEPSLGFESTVSISGQSVDSVASALLGLLKHIHSHTIGTTPSTPPPRPDGIFVIRNVGLDAFLKDRRYYSLRHSEDHENQNSLTVGEGLERSIWSHVFTIMMKDHYHWQLIGAYYAPKFAVFRDMSNTQSSHALWLSFGAVCALHIIYSGTAPEPISPFLLLAVILGQDHFHTLTYEEITSFDLDLGEKLQPWFQLAPDAPFPDSLSHPLASLIMQYCDMEVRPLQSLQVTVLKMFSQLGHTNFS